MKALKWLFLALGSLAVVFLIVAGVGYYLITSSPGESIPPLPPLPATPSTPAPATTSGATATTNKGPSTTQLPAANSQTPASTPLSPAQRLDQKIQTAKKQVEEARKTGKSKQITVVVTEEEVNAKISELLISQRPANMPFDITKVEVFFREGSLYIVMRGSTSGINITTTARCSVSIVDQKPKVTVQSIDMGKLPLPGAVKDRVNRFLAEQIEKVELIETSVDVTSVSIEGGRLTIIGVTRPDQ